MNPSLTDWTSLLNGFNLAYNTTPDTSTNYSPAFLLYGDQLQTRASLLHQENDSVLRQEILNNSSGTSKTRVAESQKAQDFMENFDIYQSQAKEALQFAQVMQQKNYNKN